LDKEKKQVVWITGASSGIGKALAHTFYQRGYTLVLSGRDPQALESVATEFKFSSDRFFILPLDLELNHEASRWVSRVMEFAGRIDVMVHNGGISQRSFAGETQPEIARKIMEVNYFGAVAITHELLPVFLQQQKGDFIVISSVSGKFGYYLRSSYSASKHALHGYFDSLRLEYGKRGISVLMVCPGKVATRISVNALQGSGNRHGKMDSSHVEGISAMECARDIMEGYDKGKFEIYSGHFRERFALWLRRMFPRFFYKKLFNQKIE
jgi:dehydrogenase/reductase SDR family member 7B